MHQTSQKAILERYTNYRQAVENASNEENDKQIFLLKYQRMASARKNRLMSFEHQCCKKTCNPMTEKQMIAVGLLPKKFEIRDFYDPSHKNIESTVYVCEYGTLHVCNKTVPPSWYVDSIPYSPCDLISTHSGEICCQISCLSLGYKQALPFVPSGNKDGSVNNGINNSNSKHNPQEDLYDDLTSYDPALRLKQQRQRNNNTNKSSLVSLDSNVPFANEERSKPMRSQLKGPRLRGFSPSSTTAIAVIKKPVNSGNDQQQQQQQQQQQRIVLNTFRDIKINTKNEEKLYQLVLKDKMNKEKRNKELDELKKNAITIKRRKSKSASNPRCKRSLSNTTGKTKQKRQKQKPKISKLMHEKLSAKIIKKKKQLQREKMREGVIPLYSDRKRSKKRSLSEMNLEISTEIEKETPTKKRKLNRARSETESDRFSKISDEETSSRYEDDVAVEEDRDEFSYLRFPKELNALSCGNDPLEIETKDDAFANGKTKKKTLHRNRKTDSSFGLTQEEKQLRSISKSLLMDLFYSPKRTEIYIRSTRTPRDRGERAVKSKWAKATKEYKERKKNTSESTKPATGNRRRVQFNKKSSVVVVSVEEESETAIVGKKENFDRLPNYVGFNSMTGFTIYRNMVLKFTKIKKTPQLPVNENFIEFFTRHAILQWNIIKKSPYGQSIIKNNSDNKRIIQGDVTLSSFVVPSSSSSSSFHRTKRNVKTIRKNKSEIDEENDSAFDFEHSTEEKKDTKKTNVSDDGTNVGPKKQNHGTLSFLGLCLALLYIMRVDNKMVMGRTVVPYCKYVAENIPQIKDLEEYDTKYQCKLITRSTEILQAAYRDMVEKHALHKEDLDSIENIVYKGI